MVAAYANRAPPATVAWVKQTSKKYSDLTNNALGYISGCVDEVFGRFRPCPGVKRDQLKDFLRMEINRAFARPAPAQVE